MSGRRRRRICVAAAVAHHWGAGGGGASVVEGAVLAGRRLRGGMMEAEAADVPFRCRGGRAAAGVLHTLSGWRC